MKVHEDTYVAYIPTLAVLPGVEWGGNAWERLSFTFFTFCFKWVWSCFEIASGLGAFPHHFH